MRSRLFFSLSLALALFTQAHASDRIPGSTWQKYSDVKQAGFDETKLAEAKKLWETIDSSSFFVVYKGAVLCDWGDSKRRFMQHSVRKSLMSGVYGLYVDKGVIDLDKTMKELGIDDKPALTETEKTATIRNLLMSRSGVYKLAAYEPAQNPKPPRGAFPPGAKFVYNNWDFNVLVTIFEQETKQKFFEAFRDGFAKPLDMQDFRLHDGYYHLEPEKSIHPAYPFRMSARDAARYGLLYLHKGLWGDKRILSEKWIRESTTPVATDSKLQSYSYLWWHINAEPFQSLGMYTALGVGTQTIQVIPGMDMVIVNRANTFDGHSVDMNNLLKVTKAVLDAKISSPIDSPKLEDIRDPKVQTLLMTDKERQLYAGDYGDMGRVVIENNELMLRQPQSGNFILEKLSPIKFRLEDSQALIFFELDPSGKAKGLVNEDSLNALAYKYLGEKKFDEAISTLKRALTYYPESANLFDSLGEAHMLAGHKEEAIANYKRSLQLNPRNTNAEQMLKKLGG